jgi:hypothetical protein
MRAHTAGKARGRYICPIVGGVFTHGLGRSVELAEPMRLVFQPGWDNDRSGEDPERPGWNQPVTYHRSEPDAIEQEYLDRAGGRVFGPCCVISRDFTPPRPGDHSHGRAGVYLVPAADADPAAWFVNQPVTYKKCAACPAKVIASDETRMDREWVPARQSFWRGSGWRMRQVEISQGPHPAGSYACRDCRPVSPAPQPQGDLPQPGSGISNEPGREPPVAAETGQEAREPGEPGARSGPGANREAGGPAGDGPAGGDDAVAALHDAIGVVSAVCDYARKDDGRGFNAADTWLGHVLAQMPAEAWTGEEALAAWDMLRKYRGQLASAGIDYDQLPRPAGADELEAERREEARERARQRAREHARQWRDQQYRQAHTYLRCDGDGEQVTLAFPYDPALVDACRKIPGRRYDGTANANVFPFTSLPAVIELAEAHAIKVTADVRALAAIAAGEAAEHAALPQIRADDGAIIIDAPFNPDLNQALKDANGGRSTWDRAAKVHRLRARAALDLPALAGRFGLRVSDQARAAITAESQQQGRNRAAASAFEADPVPVPGLAGGMSLKPQQYPVVQFALEHRRVLIGDDMGWGKTLSSLAAVAADGAWPAVVVCRPSLTLNWAGEITRFFPALTVYQATGTTPQPVPPGTDVVIIGSAALAAKPSTTGDGGKEFGWITALATAGPKALIIDEGQDTKERAANRSQACEQLAAAVIASDGLVLDLTGTAILNRPRELCQQLTILGRIGEFGGPKAFLWRYCLSETNQWGASYNGARNLIELHDRLRAWGLMIRRSDDAALGLPPCREHVLGIPDAGLDQAAMARYRQAEADLLGYLAEQARKTAERLGVDPASAAVKAAMITSAAERAEHLVAINTLRQLAGQAKRGYVTAWVREHVAAGEKVMIAAHHRDQVDAYAAEFGGLKLQGGQSVEEKETAKSAFQEQPAAVAPVIAVAIGAGGVGHTLTAARIGIQAEQAWTPGETQQMKKRLHRIGQDRPVDYYITVAEGTIDEHLWQVVTAKQATLNAVLDGRSDEGAADDQASVAAELTWRLTQQSLGNPPAGTAAEPGGGHDDHAATPEPEWTWKWSGEHIDVYAGNEITGRIYRDQGPRGTFYRADTASDPHRSLASDREVARHLPGIDAAVEALRAVRDRDDEPPGENHPGLGAACDGTRSHVPPGSQPDHDGVPGHATEAASSQRQASAAGERETTASAVSDWVAADHGSLDGPVRPLTHRVLVTGSRTWIDEQAIAEALATHWHDGNALLVTGACPRGADEIAERIWRSRGGLVERHPAEWQTGRDAGMRRNAAMVGLGADVCLAFIRDGSPGATHAARLAEQAEIPVHRFEVGSPDASGQNAGGRRSLAPAGRRYGPRDEITVRHWQEAHVDPDKVRAWCRDTGRDVPPARGPLPRDLVADYLADRGSQDIPMPGGPARADWLAQRPVLREPITARLGPFTVVYGPCPRCGHPAAAEPGGQQSLCLGCESRSGDHGGPAAPVPGSGEPPRHSAPDGGGPGQPGLPAQPAQGEDDDDEAPAQARITGQHLREAAHRYLEDGLLPVPAWASRPDGGCCCPRGRTCPRPGKHPRSVHTGPGPHDYSWKPLACRTHAEVDERFAPGGEYAAGNLMVAIPAGMMAIDRDDDDGGRAAVARLAGELGELPPTLSHRTPHGEHLIYRTPPGWAGRAWVGKDPANPVPPGIDLRMPGQILMAAPSAVPGPDGPARYGPVTGDHVAPLPAAYVTAWTPPQPQPRPAGPRVPVPPDSADRAARYVHDAMTRIVSDLAARQPGGRNAAAYAAGLKAGSLLGAARATPGAEQAAAEWTDEAAEEALMAAAERNGYAGKDGPAEARRAIWSGLQNGLRSPRALPDFTTTRQAPDHHQPSRRAAAPGPARPQPGPAAAVPGRRAGRWQDMVPGDIRAEIEAADRAASDRRRAAIAVHQHALEQHDRSATPDTAAEVERTRSEAHAAHQAYTQDGRHVTGRHDAAMLRWAASIAAQRERHDAGIPAGQHDSPRMQANRAAVAANEAYRAGDLDQARQLTDQAAALDPSRAGLWEQHRQQIAARRLILDARAAHGRGDHQRGQELLGEARQLDPRMPAIWDGNLPSAVAVQPARQAREHDGGGPGPREAADASLSASPVTGGAAWPQPGTAPHACQETPRPSWPSLPARRQPARPAPAPQADSAQPSAQRPTAATPREPRPRPGTAAGGTDTGTEPADSDPAPRWPAPDPRTARHADQLGQQATHEVTPQQERAAGHSGAAADRETGSEVSPDTPAASAADWRDQILSQARQPWQLGPSWPHNPALHSPPERQIPVAGIEPGQ